ncbi:MAG: MBL fold metallo-hydrolase, partial [Candidatus Poribacteria bacterium]|nr:MBL fold metallo-hydrolase [Candidatus Poribacteria bacterium]
MLKKLTDRLFFLEDTCSVYGITVDGKTCLIDCGTHTSLQTLEANGVRQVERVLLTHFHRDSCSAADHWKGHGAEVVVPFAERRFFEESDLLKASYDTYDNYTSYYPGFAPLADLHPDQYAYDYESLSWQGVHIEVIPLPGHTFGAVGYFFELDGQRILACGDLMSGPGVLREYFWSQWKYMDFQGHVNHLESLKTAAALEVDLILPGHGEPFAPTADGFAQLQDALKELYELFYARSYEDYRPEFRQLTPHVYEVTNSIANTYIVRDDAGGALFIDCGFTSNAPISANPHRFIDNLTPYLEAELGVHTVEWFLPSHYHDDHLAGYPALKTRYGTRVVSSPELKDILEHPERYDMPCLVPQGMEVAHVVKRGEAFHWRGIDFFVEQHPGQTLYHHLIWFEVDGGKFLCIGDNISGLPFREKRDYTHSFIPKNRTPVSSYRDMPRQILDQAPDLILTGHGGAVPFDRAKVERWRDWMDRWQDLFTQVIDQPHPNMGMDPHWVEFYPYKIRIRPGEVVTFQVTVTNHEAETRTCNLRFRSVEGVQLLPGQTDLQVPAGGHATCPVKATFPDTFTTHALPVLADVTWNGRSLGEIA